MAYVLLDGHRIKCLRERNHLNQDELARKADVDTRTISRLETSTKPTRVFPNTARRLAEALGETVQALEQNAQDRSRVNCTQIDPCRNRTADEHPSSLRVIDNLKVLTIPEDPSRVHLRDLWIFHSVNLPVDIRLVYLTTGADIDGHCVSHPDQFRQLKLVNNRARPGRHTHMEKSYEMVGFLEQPSATGQDGSLYTVEFEMTFVEAFGPDQRMFQVHMQYPTEQFTLTVNFPNGRAFQAIRGVRVFGSNLDQERSVGTLLSAQDGSFANWRVHDPDNDGLYEMRWE